MVRNDQRIKITGQMLTVKTLVPSKSVLVKVLTEEEETFNVVLDNATVIEGEHIEMEGSPSSHHPFARYFIPHTWRSFPKRGLSQQARYIAKGLGCSIEVSNRILSQWGDTALETLDKMGDRLYEIEGIPETDIPHYKTRWSQFRNERDNETLYKELGLTSRNISRLRQRLGWGVERLNEAIRDNPFLPYLYIQEAPFDKAQARVELLEWSRDDPRWIEAISVQCMRAAEAYGHTFLDRDRLSLRIRKKIKIPLDKEALDALLHDLTVRHVLAKDDDRFYLTYLLQAELDAKAQLGRLLCNEPNIVCPQNAGALIKHAVEQAKLVCTPEMEKAIEYALRHKCAVLDYPVYGEPGRFAVSIHEAVRALQGEAVVGCVNPDRVTWFNTHFPHIRCVTISDLLAMDETGEPERYHDSPINTDHLILLDSGLIDIRRFAMLLNALKDETTLTLIGDKYGVNTMGAGRPMLDLIEAEYVPSISLTPKKISGPSAAVETILKHPKEPINSGNNFWHIDVAKGELLQTLKHCMAKTLPAINVKTAEDFCLLVPTRAGRPDGNALTKLCREFYPVSAAVPIGDVSLAEGQLVSVKKSQWEPYWPVGYRARINEVEALQHFSVTIGNQTTRWTSETTKQLESANVVVPYGLGCLSVPVVILIIPSATREDLLHRQLLYQAAASAEQHLIVLDEGQRLSLALDTLPPRVFSGFSYMLADINKDIS